MLTFSSTVVCTLQHITKQHYKKFRTSILLIILFVAYSGFDSKLAVCTFYSYVRHPELPGSLLVCVMIFYGFLPKNADRVNVESNKSFLAFAATNLILNKVF